MTVSNETIPVRPVVALKGGGYLGGWGACDGRTYFNSTFYQLLPDDLRPLVKLRRTTYLDLQYDAQSNTNPIVDAQCSDYLWTISSAEATGTYSGVMLNTGFLDYSTSSTGSLNSTNNLCTTTPKRNTSTSSNTPQTYRSYLGIVANKTSNGVVLTNSWLPTESRVIHLFFCT